MLYSLGILNHDETKLKERREHGSTKMGTDSYFLSYLYRRGTARKPRHGAFRVTEQCGLKCRHRDAENASRFVRFHLVRLITDLEDMEFPASFLKDKETRVRETTAPVHCYSSKLTMIRPYVIYLCHKRVAVKCWL